MKAAQHMPRHFAILNHRDKGRSISEEVSKLCDDPDEKPMGITPPSSGTFDETELERELCAAASKRTWLIGNTSSYAPIVISLLALFLSVYSAFETRRHDRLSAAPYTQFYYQLQGTEEEVGLYYTNAGLGPALVSSIRAYFDGRRIHSFDEVAKKTSDLYKSVTPAWDYSLPLSNPVSIPSNVKLRFFFTKVSNLQSRIEFGDMLHTRLFIILYSCSMYNDCSYKCSTVRDEECRSQEIRLDPDSAQIKPSPLH
jgi:hypothetical protein